MRNNIFYLTHHLIFIRKFSYLFFLLLFLLFFHSCQKIEELASTLFSSEDDCVLCPSTTPCAPGSKVSKICPVPPEFYDFYIKNRQSGLTPSLDLFRLTNAQLIAETNHFVLYRETALASLMNVQEAETFLVNLETAYEDLKNVYGAGEFPDVQKTERIVILAVDIKDDYSITNPSFISGFFLPADLYSDEVTQNIFLDSSNVFYYADVSGLPASALVSIGGHSNENNIIYMDLNPFYNGIAFASDVNAQDKAKNLFLEAALHELSHLFTYNKRVLVDKNINHSSWIAEGIAEQAPHLLAGVQQNQIERMSQLDLTLIQEYLRNGPSILDLNSSGNTLSGYIQSNLFFNYLRHRAGSNTRQENLFNEIVVQPSEGVSGLDKTITSFWAGNESFATMYGDWVITNYLSATGKKAALVFDENSQMQTLGDGNYPSLAYNLSYKGVDINKKGGSSPAFGNNSLPLSYDDSLFCLNPASFLYFDYAIKGDEDAYIPFNKGMQDGLKLVVSYLVDDSNVYLNKYNYKSSIPLDAYSSGAKIQFLIYNPKTNGSCIPTGLLPWDTRNIASWIGEGRTGWYKKPGASDTTNGNGFTRPTGIAFSFKNVHASLSNYIYVADKSNQGVSRWDLDTGAFKGRMGSEKLDQCSDTQYENSVDCTGAGESWLSNCEYDSSSDDGWRTTVSERLVNNHCRRSFSSPQGMAVDIAGNIYIADSDNHRIIKRDKDGNFVAWLGSPTDDKWQCEPGSTNPDCSGMGVEDPLSPGEMTDSEGEGGLKEAETDLKMFLYPYGVAVDESDPDPNKHYLYVVNYGTSRVVRRKLSDGSYQGFIGNGYDNWNMVVNSLAGTRSTDRKYFYLPSTLVVDSDYLYISDWVNDRISRWTKSGKHESISGDITKVWMGGDTDGWHNNATIFSAEQKDKQSNKLAFYNPQGIGISGNYLYIADWMNQRVVRRSKDTGNFAGWIGGGFFEWEMSVESTPLVTPSSMNYPPLFATKPVSVAIGSNTETGSKHSYLYLSTVYDNRISRWNLDCVENNITGDCSED